MRWINQHKRVFRFTFLIAVVIAISGPWFFDRINVPAQYACSAPNVRLDDDFCGLPLSVTWLFFEILRNPFDILRGLVTNVVSFNEAFRRWIFFLCLFLLLLPVLSSGILILRGEPRRWMTLHIVGLALAAGIGGCIAWLVYSRASWMLWGLWSYIALTISMLALEVLTFRFTRKDLRETQLPRT